MSPAGREQSSATRTARRGTRTSNKAWYSAPGRTRIEGYRRHDRRHIWVNRQLLLSRFQQERAYRHPGSRGGPDNQRLDFWRCAQINAFASLGDDGHDRGVVYGKIPAKFSPKSDDIQRIRTNYVTTSGIEKPAERHESATHAPNNVATSVSTRVAVIENSSINFGIPQKYA